MQSQIQFPQNLLHAISAASQDAELWEAVEWLSGEIDKITPTLASMRGRKERERLTRHDRRRLKFLEERFAWLGLHAGIASMELARRQMYQEGTSRRHCQSPRRVLLPFC